MSAEIVTVGALPKQVPADHPARAFRPPGCPVYEKQWHVVAKIRSYSAGGYECTIRKIDLQARADAQHDRGSWRRYQPLPDSMLSESELRRREESRVEARLRYAMQIKTHVRQLCVEIQADRMLTFSTREKENSRSQLLKYWKRFVDLYDYHCLRTGKPKPEYVAVPEPHPRAAAAGRLHYHLHVAMHGYHHIDLLRRLWCRAIAGRGAPDRGSLMPGTVNVPPVDPKKFWRCLAARRAVYIASYISKYLTKTVEGVPPPPRFARHYWASHVDLQPVRQSFLEEDSPALAFFPLLDRLGVNPRQVLGTNNFFQLSSASLIWFRVIAGENEHPPPF